MTRLGSLRTLVLLTATVTFTMPAGASGGKVVLRTNNAPGAYYYGLGGTGEDRFITEYPDGTYAPNAIICGARIWQLTQGAVPPPGVMRSELRLEDPANPGFPDLSPSGLIILADPESERACGPWIGKPRIPTFGGGAGVPDPGANHFVCAIEPPQGTWGTLDFCGIQLDTRGPPLGFSKTYSAGGFGTLPWNHFLELVVLESRPTDLNVRAHGVARFPGDGGIPVVFANRPNRDGIETDDAISLTIAIDSTEILFTRNLEICADRSVVSPSKGLTSVTRLFRRLGETSPIERAIRLPRGRTILRLEMFTAGAKSRIASLTDRRTINLPLRLFLDDPAFDTDPCALDAIEEVDSESLVVGLRRRAGSPDDDVADAFFVVQSPSAPGDSLNVRHRAIDLPRTAAFTISGLEVVGGEFGGSGLPGLDAVQLRSDDPVFPGSPDLSSAGLVRSVGVPDGIGEVRLPGSGTTVALDVRDIAIEAGALSSDVFVVALLLPGETMPVTAIGADQVPGDTLLGDSSFTTSGILPATFDATSNYMLRLLLDGDRATLEGIGPPATVSERAFLRRVGEFVAIDHETGERR